MAIAGIDELELEAGVGGIPNRWPAVGLAVGVVRDRRLEFFSGHGLADIATNSPVTQDTVFRIASVTKLAGRDDFLFPPEHQRQLAAGIPGARLQIIERAGHNAHSEQSAEVLRAVTDFISADGDLLVADREYRCDIPEQSL